MRESERKAKRVIGRRRCGDGEEEGSGERCQRRMTTGIWSIRLEGVEKEGIMGALLCILVVRRHSTIPLSV